MVNIPPFQRHSYDVIKVKIKDGVYKYDLIDKFTRFPVKYNSNVTHNKDTIAMFSQMGVG